MPRRRDPVTGLSTMELARRAEKTARRAVRGVKKAKLVGLVKNVIMRKARTKTVSFYQSWNDGTKTTRATGLYSDRGWATQNNQINTNNTDILQVIPFCYQGLEDNQRLGETISPVGLNIRGCIRINYANNLSVYNNADLKVVIYVVQHVQLKDYTNLYSKNDFTQLLQDNDAVTDATQQFDGQSWQSMMPVANEYYRLLKKKVITLRYAGLWPKPTTPTASTGVPNSHNYFANYSINLRKQVPKLLKYPLQSIPTNPLILNTPTNSSIFMCMGFYQQNEPANGATFDTAPQMEQTYVSTLTFKDL